MVSFFTDTGPDYSCPNCGANTLGEIGHECGEEDANREMFGEDADYFEVAGLDFGNK